MRFVRHELYALKPEFCSVTFGAGGSTQEGTFNTVRHILGEGVPAASHFSCVGATKVTVRAQLATLKSMGVKRLVALRGDLPSGYGAGGEFHYASDLVAFIRAETGDDFFIEVAAYPEVHPQAKSPDSDLQAFAAKVRAGANSAITQYFYNSDAYFRFLEDIQSMGLEVPVIPGIMPITNVASVARMAHMSGASIPAELLARLEAADESGGAAEVRKVGVWAATELSQQLLDAGAPGLHFYTMNRSGATLDIYANLGLAQR